MACCAQNENNKRNSREKKFWQCFKTPFRQIWYSKYKDFQLTCPDTERLEEVVRGLPCDECSITVAGRKSNKSYRRCDPNSADDAVSSKV